MSDDIASAVLPTVEEHDEIPSGFTLVGHVGEKVKDNSLCITVLTLYSASEFEGAVLAVQEYYW